MASIAELRAIALLDGKQFQAEIAKIGNSTERTAQGMSRLGGMIAGAFSVGAIMAFGRRLLTMADDMQTAANTFGVSMQSMIGLGNAMAESGIKSESFLRILGKLQEAQSKVIAGDTRMAAGLKILGISQEQFVSLGVDDLLARIAKAYADAGGSAEAFGAINDIFGERIGPQMIEVLQRINTEGLDKFRQSAEGAAAGMSELARASDTFEKLGNDAMVWAAKTVGAMQEVAAKAGQISSQGAGGGFVAGLKSYVRMLVDPIYAARRIGGFLGAISGTQLEDPQTGPGGITGTGGARAPSAGVANAASLRARIQQQEEEALRKRGDLLEREAASRDKLYEQQDALAADFARQRADIMDGKGIAAPEFGAVDALQRIGGLVGGVAGGDQSVRIAERQARTQEAIRDLARGTNDRLERLEQQLRELGTE